MVKHKTCSPPHHVTASTDAPYGFYNVALIRLSLTTILLQLSTDASFQSCLHLLIENCIKLLTISVTRNWPESSLNVKINYWNPPSPASTTTCLAVSCLSPCAKGTYPEMPLVIYNTLSPCTFQIWTYALYFSYVVNLAEVPRDLRHHFYYGEKSKGLKELGLNFYF